MKQVAERIGKGITRFLDLFYPLFRKLLPAETYHYAATGGLNMILDITLYFVFYHFVFHEEIFKIGFIAISPYIAAFIFVFPITFSTGFFMAKFVTFTRSELKGKKQLLRYAFSVGGSILLNYLLLKLFVAYFHIFPTPSKMLTSAIVIIYSFLMQKFFTFKTGKRQIHNIKSI